MKTGQMINVENNKEPIYTLPIVQTIGESTTDIMSQKSVSDLVDGLNKSDIGLGNVDNTSDINKPISTATQNALSALDTDKADKSEIPTQLPNPHKIVFTGAVVGEYDGSQEKTFNVPSGGSSINVMQEIGQSTTDVMSQKAVTDELNNKANIGELITFTSDEVANGVILPENSDISITGETNNFVITSTGSDVGIQFVAGSAAVFTFPENNGWSGDTPTFEQGKLYTVGCYKGSWLSDKGRGV